MNEVTLTSGETVQFDKVIIHENGWLECREMHNSIAIKGTTHLSPREVESVDESDEPDKLVTYK